MVSSYILSMSPVAVGIVFSLKTDQYALGYERSKASQKLWPIVSNQHAIRRLSGMWLTLGAGRNLVEAT